MAITGSSLPERLWSSKVLHLPTYLVDAHRSFLTDKDWMDEYSPNSAGGKGGESAEEAKEHVINRFLNSAARMQYVCSDPSDEQPDIRSTLLEQMADGQVDLLDLAAGNGSGTLAILALLCELRNEKLIPKLPLNVLIRGVDFSAVALNFYAEILGKIEAWLQKEGIEVCLELSVCNLLVPGEFNEVLEDFFERAKSRKVRRFLCVISAISGVKKEGVEGMRDSLASAASWLSSRNRNSSILWVEPVVGKTWINKVIESISLTLKQVAHVFAKKDDSFQIKSEGYIPLNLIGRNFTWFDPHLSKKAKSHVTVVAMRNE